LNLFAQIARLESKLARLRARLWEKRRELVLLKLEKRTESPGHVIIRSWDDWYEENQRRIARVRTLVSPETVGGGTTTKGA